LDDVEDDAELWLMAELVDPLLDDAELLEELDSWSQLLLTMNTTGWEPGSASWPSNSKTQ
jgi:hypothetical protein